jgi:hypothetical protein
MLVGGGLLLIILARITEAATSGAAATAILNSDHPYKLSFLHFRWSLVRRWRPPHTLNLDWKIP